MYLAVRCSFPSNEDYYAFDLYCFFFYKYLGGRILRRICGTVMVIGVIAAVPAAVLLIVGSVLSTQNGQYTCLNISSYVVVLEVCSSNICSVVDLEF